MLTRKEIERKNFVLQMQVRYPEWEVLACGRSLGIDAIAKHDALLEIYHLLGGEGEPEDVVDACKKQAEWIYRLAKGQFLEVSPFEVEVP